LGKIGGLMVKEIAFGTVLARLHRGRKRFEQELWTYAEDTRLLLKGTVR
jgi:RNA polymerase sigma-70 factor, ECF subfamily